METEAIRKILAYYRDDVECWADLLGLDRAVETTVVGSADAELAALEAENARLREALSELMEDFEGACSATARYDPEGSRGWQKGAAALASAPSDLVVVERERLRAIEWMHIPQMGIFVCPVCGQNRSLGHAPNCWLASLIGEERLGSRDGIG